MKSKVKAWVQILTLSLLSDLEQVTPLSLAGSGTVPASQDCLDEEHMS